MEQERKSRDDEQSAAEQLSFPAAGLCSWKSAAGDVLIRAVQDRGSECALESECWGLMPLTG